MHSPRTFLIAAVVVVGCFALALSNCCAQIKLTELQLSDKKTYLLKTSTGNRYAGRVDLADPTGLVMTRRNGRIVILEPHEIKSIKKVDDTFYAKSFQQMRASLQKEFGSKYVVSATRHFLVVHPPGDYERWALPFEQLYARFEAYFKTRGFVITEPEFPMVAIVLRTRNEFVQMAKVRDIPAGVVGYYAFHSNRLIAYQRKIPWRNSSQNWADTMDTIIHEATHQTAANTGIHSRLGVNPRWVTEGLATMFEAKGVNNYFKYPEFKTRINWEQLHALRELYENGKVEGTVEQLVNGDSVFDHDSNRAYAVSWALSLYLAERNPHRYVQYLEMLQQDEFSSSLNASNRAKYFFKAFGEPAGIEADLRRFVNRMPKSEDK
ncbi:DUF1570 domain-containing protein [Mariniblastus fucicola]|uniref:DUF1570 domain-containing protein n=1 Tax=Mariniblastus fucicola TaxID=980251 RepID=A0A5B9PEF2_9BACT|nr:DUF1570 domain-containing protein [Mariniblastus fucicola]QEG23312.1 hypothetical protein MFFC18_32080 [Mariniblastus fucicola]